jgi:hygromycin-B 4-O-kinase
MHETPRLFAAEQLQAFLVAEFDETATNVVPLGAGDWSNAFAFTAASKDYVLRLGQFDEDYAKDLIGATFRTEGLPVPKFVAMGPAFDRFYAITERATGHFLDQLSVEDAKIALPSMFKSLNALRQTPTSPESGFGLLDRHGRAGFSNWKDALLSVADERERIAGWTTTLAAWPECQAIFDECFAVFSGLVQSVEDRHHIIHSDLLNRNVLVGDSGEISSIFDWGCAMYGDHLYDIAWLSFCRPWTLGMKDVDIKAAALRFFSETDADVSNFDDRVRCYEVHIGLGSIAYNAFAGRREVTQEVCALTARVALQQNR